MKKLLNTLLTTTMALIIMAVAGCTSINPAAELASADNAIANGDYDLALKICNNLLQKHESSLSATQLTHLSLLFMTLVDQGTDGDGVEHAAQCFRSALKLNPDSVSIYCNSLPMEQQKNAILVMAIVQTFDHTEDIDTEWEEDSISLDDMPEMPPFDHDHDHDHGDE